MKHTNNSRKEARRMKRTHKIIIAIALSLVLCTGAALLAQAFFQAFTGDVDGTVTVTPPADGNAIYVSVATEADLIKATKDEIYNSPEDISDAAKRVIILLTEDITLTQDLLITRDCHIDLGGKTLDTNGHAVTVYHTYTGTFVITHGTMIGTLNVNTPNAAVLVDSTVIATNLTQNVAAISPEAVCKAALSMVCAHLSNNLDHGIYGLLGYNQEKCTLPNYSEHFGCDHTAGCSFTVGEPDLPRWFFGYDDLKITYTTASASGVDTLTATVTYGTASDTQDFIIHNISATDYATLAKAATAVVMKELDSYKKLDQDGNVVLDENGKSVYEFKTAIRLPDTVSIGAVEAPMTYGTTTGSVTNGLYSPADEDSLTIQCGPFVDGGDVYTSGTISTTGSVSQLLDSPYTKANRVIKELLGTEIIIEKDGDVYIPRTWESDVTQLPTAVAYGVTEITYTLSNNEDNFYELISPDDSTSGDWELVVTPGSTPEEYALNKVFVQASVTIKDTNGSPVEIIFSVPIKCQVSSAGGDVISQFLPYYHYFNEIFTQVTNGNNTYRNFYMPTQYTDGSLAIEFYLVDKNNVAGGGEYTFYSFTNPDHTNAINTILGTTSAETRFINVTQTDDGTQWQFTIQPEYIGYADKEVVFGYWYQFTGESGKLFDNNPPESGKYTMLTVPGVVNQENKDAEGFVDMPDPNLYAYIYSILYPDTSFTRLSDYILYSDISKPIGKVDESKAWDAGTAPNTTNAILNFEGRTDIASYEGLELLTGATGINLENSGIDEAELQYVAGMESLQYLNLANNGLTDGQDFAVGDDILAPLTALTKLEILHLENNTIYSFASLSELPALKTVYVQNNNPSVAYFEDLYDTWLIGGIFEALDNTMTGIVQDIYGSTGSINIAEFSSICHRVDVYNTSATDKFSPELGGANDFTALSNLEYQDKIPNNATDATIQAICDEMQTDLGAYGITPKTSASMPTLITEATGNYEVGDLGPNKVHTNYIEFLYLKEGNAEYIVLRYHDFVQIGGYIPVDENGNRGDPITVAVEYYVDFKYPLTRLPAEEQAASETN